MNTDDEGFTPKATTLPGFDLETDHKQAVDIEEKPDPSVTSAELPESGNCEAVVTPHVTDLLGLDELTQEASDLDDKNSLALAIATPENPSNSRTDQTCQSTSWEHALVTAPSSNGTAVTDSKLGGGLDRLILDSLYDDALARRRNHQNGTHNVGEVATNPLQAVQYTQDPFYASNNIAPPRNVQMEQVTFMQMQMQMQPPVGVHKLVGNPFVEQEDVMASQNMSSSPPYAGLI